MNSSLLLLAAVLSVDPIDPTVNLGARPETEFSVYEPSAELSEAVGGRPDLVIRGQNPDRPYEEPLGTVPLESPNYTYQPPAGGGLLNPLGIFSPPPFQDPFLAPPPPGAVMPGGTTGPQPYRMGMTPHLSVSYLPQQDTDHGLGKFGMTEVDLEVRHNQNITPATVFTINHQFGARYWEGPGNRPGLPVNLPGSVYRFGWDFKFATPSNGMWSSEIAFNPSINTDLDKSISHNAINLDGRAMLFFRPSRQLMFVGGAGFWDRVHDQIVPYVGFVFTPDDWFEYRILYPESRISMFLGKSPYGVSQWLYLTGKYNVEAYEIAMPGGSGFNAATGLPFASARRDKIELEDYRILLGMRWEGQYLAGFIEGGWVFGRNVNFARSTNPDFGIDSGFIGRIGLRF
ncbi:MAG: hypothetical protein O3A00_07660 [Planctomycetota bacterium]|nr:hypothetical protein [Planctomycetota bacterium]